MKRPWRITRPPALTLQEKVYLVAVFGDISEFNRDRWFRFETGGSKLDLAENIADVFGPR